MMPDRIFNEKEIKKAKVMGILAILLVFVSFGALALAAFMQDSLHNNVIIPLAVISFIGCNVLAVFFIFKSYPVLIYIDCRRMDQTYENQPIKTLALPAPNDWKPLLMRYKFKDSQDGYYRRKKLSFLKDSIHYVIRITRDTEPEHAFHQEISRLERTQRKWNNLCLILLVYMDDINEDTLTTIKDLGKNRIITETVIYPKSAASVIVVAVDHQTGLGYFLDTARYSISLYGYGCRLLKKMAGSPAASVSAASTCHHDA